MKLLFLRQHRINICVTIVTLLFSVLFDIANSQSIGDGSKEDPFKKTDKYDALAESKDKKLWPVDIRSLLSKNKEELYMVLTREEILYSSCWAVMSPSFYSHRAVAVQETKMGDSLSYKVYALWFGKLREWTGVNKRTDLSDLKTTHREIAPELAKEIIKAWKIACAATGYAGRDVERIKGVDGISYYFGVGSYCGMAWTPENGTSKMFATLAEELFDYCNFMNDGKVIIDICHSLSEGGG